MAFSNPYYTLPDADEKRFSHSYFLEYANLLTDLKPAPNLEKQRCTSIRGVK